MSDFAAASDSWGWGTWLDVNADSIFNAEDVHEFARNPSDLNGDGQANQHDTNELLCALRSGEEWSLLPIERLQNYIPQFVVYPNSTSYAITKYDIDGVTVEYFGARSESGVPLTLERIRFTDDDHTLEVQLDSQMRPVVLHDLQNGSYIRLDWLDSEEQGYVVAIWGGNDGIEGADSVETDWPDLGLSASPHMGQGIDPLVQNTIRFNIETDEGRAVPHEYADISVTTVNPKTDSTIDTGLLYLEPIQGTDDWKIQVPNPCAPQVPSVLSAEAIHQLGINLCQAAPSINGLVSSLQRASGFGRVFQVLSGQINSAITQACRVTVATQRSLVTFGGTNLVDRFVNRQSPEWPDSFEIRVNARMRDGASRATDDQIQRSFELESCPQPSAEPTTETLFWARANGFRPPELTVRDAGFNNYKLWLSYPLGGMEPDLFGVIGVGEVAAYQVYLFSNGVFIGSRAHRSENRNHQVCMPDIANFRNSAFVGYVPHNTRSLLLEVEGCNVTRFFAFTVTGGD